MAKHNIGDYSIEAGENGLETEAFSIERAHIGVDPSEGGKGILDAINELPSAGGVVDLKQGVYEFETTYEIPRGNFIVRGVGSETIWKPADNRDPDDYGTFRLSVGSNSDPLEDITFRDFHIDGNRENQPEETIEYQSVLTPTNITRLRVFNVSVFDSADDSLEASGNDHWFHNIHLKNGVEDELHLNGVSDVRVTNSIIEQNDNVNLMMSHGGAGNVVVANNTIRGAGQEAVVLHADSSQDTNYVFANNNFYGNSGGGINAGVGAGDASFDNIAVVNNNFRDCNGFGPIVLRADRATVANNTFYDCDRAIRVVGEYGTITGNVMSRIFRIPIRLEGEQLLCESNVIKGGSGSNVPIELTDLTYSRVQSNQIAARGFEGDADHAIEEKGESDYNLIYDNETRHGVWNDVAISTVGTNTLTDRNAT